MIRDAAGLAKFQGDEKERAGNIPRRRRQYGSKIPSGSLFEYHKVRRSIGVYKTGGRGRSTNKNQMFCLKKWELPNLEPLTMG